MRSSGRPLVAITPFMPIVANSHTRAVLTNRSRAVTRRAMPCCAVKQDQKRRSTQNTTHIDGSQQEQDKSTTNKQLTFQKRRYHSRHRPWQSCIRSSRRPLVGIMPFIRTVANGHTRGTSINRRRYRATKRQKHYKQTTYVPEASLLPPPPTVA